MIEINAPDGTVIRFPEGTPEDVILRTMRTAYGAPRERMRATAQGLTFGFADEAIAAARNPISAARAALGNEEGGAAYNESLEDERRRLREYREARPVESALYEVGGALGPAALATFFTGGAAGPAAGANLVSRAAQALPSLMAQGAGFGGLYGIGTGEGGLANRALSGATGAAVGAVTGPLGAAVAYPVMSGSSTMVDALRRTMSGRGGKAVEAEVQRLAEATGLTTDEILERIARGEIMSELPSLRIPTRALMAEGGTAESMARAAFDRRPRQTREAAMGEIQRYLANTTDENVLRGAQMTREAAEEAERAAYRNLFQGGGAPVTQDVTDALLGVFQRVPTAARELNAFTRAQTGTNPFFEVLEDGTATFTRAPTVQEAEVARRYLQGKANEAYRQGSPWGEVFKDLEGAVRGPLDTASPALAATRARWADIRSTQEAFETGTTIFNRSADEVEILVGQLAAKGADGAAQLEALRNGAMNALRAKSRSGGGTNLMATLTNPERKESAILRAILPPAVYDDVATRMGVAAQSQAARNDVIKGSSTALTQAARDRSGTSLNAEEISGVFSGSLVASLNVLGKMVDAARPGLTDAQRSRVMSILLSEDPGIVRAALRDQSGMASLVRSIERATSGVQRTLGQAGAVGGTSFTNQLMGEPQ